MCGGCGGAKAKCGMGAPESDEGGCKYVYEDEPSRSDKQLPQNPQTLCQDQPSPPQFTSGIECVCFYVPSPGNKAQQFDEQRPAKVSRSPPTGPKGCGGPTFPGPPKEVQFQDICDIPPHENQAIPYPRPPLSVELRGGQIYSGCQCVKRDGLQHDCPRTGCQGKPPCMAYPAPQCVPSGNAPVETPPETPKRRGRRGGGARHQAGDSNRKGGYNPPGDDDPFVRKGRECYIENPPVERRPRVPCREHRKERC